MRYHYELNNKKQAMYGEVYSCDHPIYSRCTLFQINGKGLAVIQQRFSKVTKTTKWTEIDECLNDSLYLNSGFKRYFDERSGNCTDGIYPTVTIRQIMWALRMKPLPRARWETVFDRRFI